MRGALKRLREASYNKCFMALTQTNFRYRGSKELIRLVFGRFSNIFT
jgi:hypothetical protein